MKSYITILAAVLFVSGFGLSCFAACPSADLTGDCVVDFKDIDALTAEWLNDCNVSNDWCDGADISQNGTVNLSDFAVFAEQWLTTDPCGLAADDRIYKGRYSRPSVAYDGFNSYDVNEIIARSMPVMGFVTGATELSHEAPGSLPLKIFYTGGGYLYATYGVKIYKSLNGVDWTSAGDDAPAGIRNMWAADSIGNCVMATGANPPAIYYGTVSDSNLTFTRATKSGENFFVSSAQLDYWNFIKLASGNLLLSEYGSLPGRYIYKSTDLGHTWVEVYDPGDGIITHWHGFGQLLSTGRIVASAGDGVKAKIVYSDDDGDTWDDLYAIGTKCIQPMDFIDIGHSSKLLCADDTIEGLFLLDVCTGEITQNFFDHDRRNLRGFFWSFARNGNTIYASTMDLTTSAVGTSPVIYASDDLVNWSAIYRIASTTPYGAYKLIWFNDALHGFVSCAGATGTVHLNITPPPITHKYGVKVEQAVTNMLTDPGKSSFEDGSFASYVSSWQSTISQVAASSNITIPHGTYVVRVQKTTAEPETEAYITKTGAAYGVAVVTGQIYTASFMVGVPADGVTTRFSARYCKGNYSWSTNGIVSYFTVHPGEWKTIIMPPITVAEADANVLGLRMTAVTLVGTKRDFLFDEVQICSAGQQPSSWQVGGTARAAAKYDFNWNSAEKWTHIFSFCPLEKVEMYNAIGGDWYIRSWYVSATVYAQLYYDADDQKFKLDIDDGVNTDSLETAALVFKKGQPLIFVVQFGDDDDAKAHLSVGHGRMIETVDGVDDFTSFGLANVLVQWGDKDSANGLNGTLYDIDFTGVTAPGDIVSYVAGKIE